MREMVSWLLKIWCLETKLQDWKCAFLVKKHYQGEKRTRAVGSASDPCMNMHL